LTAPLAVLAVSRRGADLAARIRTQLGADVFVPARLAGPARSGDGSPSGAGGLGAIAYPDAGGVRAALAQAFGRYRGIVLALPVGAAVRLIAPLIADKHADPAVVALDEAGGHAVALLSGHAGGANDLARAVAAAVGARPVITTAAEVLSTLALDLLGRDSGWTVEDKSGMTRASAALIAGEPVGACQDAGEQTWWRDAPRNLMRYATLAELAAAPVAARLVVSDRTLAEPLSPPVVVYRPKTLVLGVGCVRGATEAEIEDLVARTLAEHKLALASVRELATIDRKADEPGIRALCQRHGWALRTFPADLLTAAGAPSGASEAVRRAVGAPSVCEPAALLASGAATLVVPKTRTRRVTVAVARVPPRPLGKRNGKARPPSGGGLTQPPPLPEGSGARPHPRPLPEGEGTVAIASPGGGEAGPRGGEARPVVASPAGKEADVRVASPSGSGRRAAPGEGVPFNNAGAAPGEGAPLATPSAASLGEGGLLNLSLIGLGPGGPEGLTVQAREALEAVDAVVGYHGYLDLLRPWLAGPAYHGSPIGEEVPRARLAIALARAGQHVALVSSGDAGVYGTAGIVFELLHEDGADAEALGVEVIPGVSAAHAAAALLGAPLMNDYAAISLSDLMTPWEVIARRLEAAAAADLVVALYNPASARRHAQLARAQEIFLRHRPPETPVGLVRNAGRPGQSVRIVALGELLAEPIDMLNIVLVGNRATIRVGDRLVTRRGYLE
jgi:precorrin-3B C17-methyltransferase